MEIVFCDICDNSFASKKTLAVHKKTHALDYKVPCLTCNKLFRKTYLTRHMLKCFPAEDPQKEFNCQFGMKTCSTLFTLNRHLQSHDSMFDNVSCDLCPKTFDRKDNLNRHVKDVHEMVVEGKLVLVESKKEIPYFEMCSTSFSHRSSLKRHMNSKHKGYDDQNKDQNWRILEIV